jgi:hypothetical protein
MKSNLVMIMGVLFLLIQGLTFSQEPLDVKTMDQGSGSSGLPDAKITEGLMEALRTGTEKAVDGVSKADGYLGNPEIKIPLPKEIQKVEKILRMGGAGKKLDEFTVSMNRAAEKAAPQARSLFLDALKSISFSDAKKILGGRDNEATLYFKEKTTSQLTSVFKPLVHDTMGQTGVTKSYQALESTAGQLPGAGFSKVNLDDYVTSGAIDGLFTMIAVEEQKIRKDPAARLTDTLKDVFGDK